MDPADGSTLLARYDLDVVRRKLTRGRLRNRRPGVWKWSELLPVRQRRFITTLGEGGTPLLPPGRLAHALGLPRLHIKAESLNPTGSFKARGMAVAVSRAVELGARHLVAPSAGNAGGALAAYAAAAGCESTVVMPADAPKANQQEVLACGGRLVLLDGLISDCGRLAGLISRSSGAFNLATLREPYRLEGKKTMGFELAEDLGWRVPDVVVYPTGGGTGLIGIWKAFDELESLGLIGSDRPRMFAVQSEGCAPIVEAFQRGEATANPWPSARTRAAGIRVPATLGDHLILGCLRRSSGGATAIPDAEIEAMQLFAARAGAGYLSLESAAALAALPALLSGGLIHPTDLVVALDTGAGFKSEAPDVKLPEPLRNDPSTWPGA